MLWLYAGPTPGVPGIRGAIRANRDTANPARSGRIVAIMALTHEDVATLFGHLAEHRPEQFFAAVADDVDWTVMGTHPLAGHYRSKDEFVSSTFTRLDPRFREPARFTVTNVLVDGDWAAVELRVDGTQMNGNPFHNGYCWLCQFDEGKIVTVRAYLDSALVADVIAANEGP